MPNIRNDQEIAAIAEVQKQVRGLTAWQRLVAGCEKIAADFAMLAAANEILRGRWRAQAAKRREDERE
jgi:hypothetical protein